MMRYKSLELTNYIGIANGLGLYKIYIDFSKCKHRIVILKGDNGSGKSTIFKATQALPDSSDMFIPGTNAIKTVELIDDELNIIYTIRFEHTCKKDGGYATKGFIYKTFDGNTINLNEQGNITACKDIIYSELNLDANFMALSQLSADDKGLASKSPAERKRFASKIIETTEVYNNIHKTITKRASIFKSMINTTMSKIDKLGDESLLNSSKISISNRIATLLQKRDMEMESLGTQKAVIIQMDPTGSIQESYQYFSNAISSLSTNRSILESKISTMLNELGIKEITSEMYNEVRDKKIAIQSQIAQIESDITRLLSERETESSQLQSKISRLNALQSETNYVTMKQLISTYESKITDYELFFKEMGLLDYNLTHDEYVIGLNTLKDIKDTVDNFKGCADYDIMQTALSTFIPTNSYPDKDTLEDEINGLQEYLNSTKDKLVYYNAQLQVSLKLSMRPGKCKIDACDFIKDAVLAASEDPIGNIMMLEEERSSTEAILSIKSTELEKMKQLIMCINYFKVLFRSIDSYASILKKLPNGEIFSNKKIFIEKLLAGSNFNEIDNIYPYITQASIVEDYNKITKLMDGLRNDLKIYESKNELVLEIQDDINTLNEKVSSISNMILYNNDILFKMKSSLDQYTSKELTIKALLEILVVRDKTVSDILENQKNLKLIETSISSIQSSLLQIDLIKSRIDQMNKDISTLEKDKYDIEHSIRLLSEYRQEMSLFTAKAEKIEAIKFYSSYNTGIQTVFMELYMYKVNQIANQLMSYVLGGRFHFKKWVIDENEFKIPCLGDGGFLNDDISSLSGGELAIVSMIISFSLLYQASTKYNVLKLDEVDGTLDSTNRAQFVLVLEQLMDILRAEQTIMISHNEELNMDNADIILLRMDDTVKYNETLSVGNIIFNYKDIT